MTDFDKAIEEAKAGALPFESWERLTGETGEAYAAFVIFRDLGFDRTIRKAVEAQLKQGAEADKARREKRYNVWRGWANKYRWKERTADYDTYIGRLKQTELRKTIEAQGEKHREVTGKMLDKVSKKLDLMNPEDLTNNNVTEWTSLAIRTEREAAGFVAGNGKAESKQGEFSFEPEFQGL